MFSMLQISGETQQDTSTLSDTGIGVTVFGGKQVGIVIGVININIQFILNIQIILFFDKKLLSFNLIICSQGRDSEL